MTVNHRPTEVTKPTSAANLGTMNNKVAIIAGGTAGHIFPAIELYQLLKGSKIYISNKLFNDIEIQPLYDLYNLKHIRFNGYGIVNYGKNVQDWLEYMEKYNKTEVIHIY